MDKEERRKKVWAQLSKRPYQYKKIKRQQQQKPADDIFKAPNPPTSTVANPTNVWKYVNVKTREIAPTEGGVAVNSKAGGKIRKIPTEDKNTDKILEAASDFITTKKTTKKTKRKKTPRRKPRAKKQK